MSSIFFFIRHNRTALLIVTVLFFSSIVAYLRGQTYIDPAHMGTGSYQVQGKTTAAFSLYQSNGYIYKAHATDLQAAYEFIRQNPQQFLGPTLFGGTGISSLRLDRTVIETHPSQGEHYFFQQMIHNIPVYGSRVVIHVKHADEIYAVSGNIITDTQLPPERITQEQAQQIALKQAVKDSNHVKVMVVGGQVYALNMRILGKGTDQLTHRTQAVVISSQHVPVFFAMEYFVDLTNGDIVYKESQLEQVLNRIVYTCSTTDTCASARSEGQANVSDSVVNSVYTSLGRVYDFYQHHFGRDSFDNHGALLQAYVHRIDIGGYPCPNAAFISGTVQFCNGMAVPDLVMHELTHGITKTTAGLIYSDESGAINESMSDIFALAMTHSWTLGADITAPGIQTPVRYINDPTLRNQPDKLFSPFYSCGNADAGGLHTNVSVANKAFYLMSNGGEFNGCHMNGIGTDKSYAIEYRALSRYLAPAANFKDLYIDLLLSCNDLYGAASSTCINVEKSLEATELDQQPADEQIGPLCDSVSEQVPACAVSVPTPTPTSVHRPVSTGAPGGEMNSVLPNGCHMVTTCSKKAASMQLCTFTCE